MKSAHIFLFFFLFSAQLKSQELNPFYQNLTSDVSYENLITNLTDFEAFGVKEMGTTAQQNAMNWIINQYQSWGYDNIEQQEVSAGGEIGYNIIVTKTGTVYPDQFIIIDGHYDTINGPGVNDNGSGTAIILEIARILKDIPTEYSIKFIHFTAEELGLFGSYHYVQEIAVPQNLDIKLVLNIDQVGGVAGETNNTITCERDESSPNSNNNASDAATTQLANSMQLYSDLNTHFSYAYGSDYVPFQEQGFVITGLYETNESPYPHSPNDTFENMDPDFVFQVAKGALGALCFFAKAYEDLSVNDLKNKNFEVFPNPADGEVVVKNLSENQFEIKLMDISGKVVLSQNSSEKEVKISTSSFANGVYFLQINDEKTNSSQKLIIQHK